MIDHFDFRMFDADSLICYNFINCYVTSDMKI